MTKGDRDKLRAELAGKAMAAVLAGHLDSAISAAGKAGISNESAVAKICVSYADALMAELGIKGKE